jgi:signal transduction histidine kinase
VINSSPRREGSFADGSGTGLLGMEERVRVLGGLMRAGPQPAGGFSVHAQLPTTALGPGADAMSSSEVISS